MDFEVKISLINDGLVRYTAANRLKYTSAIVLDDLTKQLLERFDYWVGIDTPRYEKKDLALLGQNPLPPHSSEPAFIRRRRTSP